MIHPEKETQQSNHGSKLNIIMAILLFLIIVSFTFFAYLKSQNIKIQEISFQQLFKGSAQEKIIENENTWEITYDSKEQPVFCVYKDYIVKCNKDGVCYLDKKGNIIWSMGAAFNKPMVKTNGNYLLVADIGGRDIYVIDGKRVYWNDKTNETIDNAEINENGFVSIITSSQHYNGEVRVYDNHGIELFYRTIANDFAVTAKINPNQTQLLINLVNISGVKSNSCFKFFDMNKLDEKELSISNLPQENGLYPLVWFVTGGSIFAAGDRSILYMDKTRNIKWQKEYENIESVCITGSRRLAAVVKDKSKNVLKVFATNGQEYSNTDIDGDVYNISAFGGIVAISTSREAIFMTEKGRNISKYISKSNILDVLLFGRNQAAVVTRNSVAIVGF